MKSVHSYQHIICPSVDGNPRNGEGSVVELADGRLLLVYGEFYGGSDGSMATLQGLYSADGGRSWEGKHLVQPNIGGRNVMSASLLRLACGDILLSFLRKDSPRAQCTPFVRRSADEGRTWSEALPVTPVSETYYVVNNDRLVQLRGGRVLMPASTYAPGFANLGDRVFFSDDNGRTWRAPAVHPFLPESKVGAQEPGVIELRDGGVMMWCRSDLNAIHRCYSRDGGETFGPWTETGLKAPCAPSSMKRVPSTGDLLCLHNDSSRAMEHWCMTRSPLTAALSSDDGATWRVVGDVEPDREHTYCYTSINFLRDGGILLTYYLGSWVERVEDGRLLRSQPCLRHLKAGVFPVEWLYRNRS